MDFGFAFIPNGLLIGLEFYPYDNEQDYNELNIYLFFIVLHFRVYL